MPGRERADLVVWLTMVVFAVVGLSLLRGPGSLSATPFGLSAVAPGAPWLLALAALAAAVAILLREWMVRAPWPLLQLVGAVLTAVWTAALVATRHSAFDGAEVGTFLGNGLSRWLSSVHVVAHWMPPVIVGLGAAGVCVLLNATVQSLSGAVQARRLVPLIVVNPAAALVADGALVLSALAVSGVLALSAMASERGRGLWWSTGLGLLSGVLLVASGFAGFAGTAAGVGMLCIYFLRRRSLMIIVAGLGTLGSLLVAAGVLGWSWPDEFGAASALLLGRPENLSAAIVAAAVLVAAIGGPALRESMRKVRGTPAWPILLTGVIAAFLAVLTRPVDLGILPAVAVWIPLLCVAASAPPRAAGAPSGPSPLGMALTAACGLAVAVAGLVLA